MKLHIFHHGMDELNGFTNLCLSQTDDKDGELDAAVDDSEATEIVLSEALDYIPLSDLADFLDHVIKKLRHGGSITIIGTDAFTVAKNFAQYKLPIEEFNILMHGGASKPHHIKTATLTMHGVVNFLRTEFGLKVLRQSLEDYTYVIEAQRP